MKAPAHLRELAAECQHRRGTDGAARAIGICRATLTAVLADVDVSSGTIALLQAYARRREMAAAKVGAFTGAIAGALTRRGDR